MRDVRRVGTARPCQQRGVGLIEVLVAVLVLSFGLLGLAGLQLRTLRNNESSLERGMAIVQTHAIADAMRADRTNALNGKFDIDFTANLPTGTSFAESAIKTWRGNLVTALGANATGSVDCDGAFCTIIVQWDDTRGSGGEKEFQVTTEVEL